MDKKIQSTIDQLRKTYTDFLDSNPPKGNPLIYREIAAILGIAITKIEVLKGELK